MTPGNDPFAALALALRNVAVEDVPGLAEHLRVEGIAGPTARLLPEPDARLLLLVDQLEELFTHSSTEDADSVPRRARCDGRRRSLAGQDHRHAAAPITTTAPCATRRSASCFATQPS